MRFLTTLMLLIYACQPAYAERRVIGDIVKIKPTTLPTIGSSGELRVETSTDKLKKWNDATKAWDEISGGGAGGINYIDNSDAESSTNGWSTYADAAGSVPVDCDGGSATTTITRTTSSPLRGSGSFLLTKDAANRHGEGVVYAFTTDNQDSGRQVTISIDFEASANLVVGENADVRWYIYDVTNTTVLYPSTVWLGGASGTYLVTANLGASTSYRLCGHVSTSSALAYTLKFDNVQVGPQTAVQGLAGSSEFDIALTTEGLGTTTLDSFKARRVGQYLVVRGYMKTGTTTATTAAIVLPSGYVIDSVKVSSTTNANRLGTFNRIETGGSATTPDGELFYDGSTTNKLFMTFSSASDQFTKTNASTMFTSGDGITFDFKIPVSGWGTDVTLHNGSTFRMSNILANGTQITDTSEPDALGEFKVYTKNASSIAGSVDSGTAPVSAADGMHLYVVNYATAGTSTQPNRWEVFVGKNKHPRVEWYSGAGKTGNVEVTTFVSSVTADWEGVLQSYDPVTGILVIDGMVQDSTTTGRVIGRSIPSDGGAASTLSNAYFDVIVSENALAVGSEVPRCEIIVHTGNGHGSSSTYIRRFTTEQASLGTCIAYTDSGTLGGSFEVRENGNYNFHYCDWRAAGVGEFGISVDTTYPATSITSGTIPATEKLGWHSSPGANLVGCFSATKYLTVGQIVRAHTDSSVDGNNSAVRFSMGKVSN